MCTLSEDREEQHSNAKVHRRSGDVDDLYDRLRQHLLLEGISENPGSSADIRTTSICYWVVTASLG
jgi:hypothetical protein